MVLLHSNSNPLVPPLPTSPVFSMLVKIIIINRELESDSWKSFLIPSIFSLQIPASYPIVLLWNIYFHIYISVDSEPRPSSKPPPLITGISKMVFYPCHPHHFALYIEQSGCFRNIHMIKPFFYFKPLILLIAPREVQKLHPGQQGRTEQITAYLPDLFYCILTLYLYALSQLSLPLRGDMRECPWSPWIYHSSDTVTKRNLWNFSMTSS